ncbi:hypothetical protein M2451_003315, partial [Dysgonomonas sp. PFB1-18]
MANIKIIKGSELPIVEDINKSTFLAYEDKTVSLKSGRIDFKALIPLFSVSQEKGQSVTQVPSQKAWTDDSNLLHSSVDTLTALSLSIYPQSNCCIGETGATMGVKGW